MKSKQVQELSPESFRRLTGVKPPAFKRMVEILRESAVINCWLKFQK
ncbi:MAG: hypothetical protein JSR33_12295 [Proteobacteria bacterium]|nr:hypothetical protein [Pseudomonadota bacterium]